MNDRTTGPKAIEDHIGGLDFHIAGLDLAGFTRNPNYAAVQAAQGRRMAKSHALMTEDDIITTLRNLPADVAYRVARQCMAEAIQRDHELTHARPVDWAEEVVTAARGMGA